MTKFEAIRKQFSAAVARMDEILREEKTAIARDAALKRFEFTFDLAWKGMRAFLDEKKGISCTSPKDCILESYRRGVIDYDDMWPKIPDWRNEIVHEYSEEYANDLYKNLPKVLDLFKKLAAAIEKQ